MFQAGRGSKPADSVTCSAEQQPVSDQASTGTENAALNVGEVPATEDPSAANSNSNAMSLGDITTTEQQNRLNLNPVATCSAALPSSVSDATVVSVGNEQTSTATNTSESAPASKGVVIRPITTASESASKEYVFHYLNIVLLQNSKCYVHML